MKLLSKKLRQLPRVGHPAKEGLRLIYIYNIALVIIAQSGSSSKRGIKTKSYISY